MAGQAGGGQQGGGYEGIIMLVLMFAIFYFLLIRPQQKRAKQHKELVGNLKTGDQIVTAGGIHGKIVSVEENVVLLEVATGVKIKMNRTAITEVKGQA
jgi:preprotein translocase subunit YajC